MKQPMDKKAGRVESGAMPVLTADAGPEAAVPSPKAALRNDGVKMAEISMAGFQPIFPFEI